MGLSTTLLLGFIAGVTILLGPPLGRLRRPESGPGFSVFTDSRDGVLGDDSGMMPLLEALR